MTESENKGKITIRMLEQLSWNASSEEQNEAMQYFRVLPKDQLGILLQPLGKSCWENAAKILSDKGFENTKHLADGLFRWLQDLNWPGAWIILDFLRTYPLESFMDAYEKAIVEAMNTRDDSWLDFLAYYVDDKTVTGNDFHDKSLYKVMLEYINQC